MGQTWVRQAGREGGTIAGLAVASLDAETHELFAASAVGLHRSEDGGRSWSAVGVGVVPPFVEAVAPSPAFARDRTLFVGARSGVHRSTDGGETWRHVLGGAAVRAIALPPGHADDRLILAGTEADGVLRSEDGGLSWTGANAGLLDLTVLALAPSPRFDRDRTCFAATTSGLYRSRNGGVAWRAVDLGADEPVVQCLALSPTFSDDRLVLAGTEEHGLVRSRDGGATWDEVPALAGRGVLALAFASTAAANGRIAAATDAGVAVSSDGGASWRFGEGLAGPVLSLAFLPTPAGDALLAGRAGRGAARSDDGGRTWSPANAGLHARTTVAVALSPAFGVDQTVFAADLQDGVAVSSDGGAAWTDRSAGLEGSAVTGLALRRERDGTRTLYAGTDTGAYAYNEQAARWRPMTPGATPTGVPPAAVVASGGDGSAPILIAVQGDDLYVEDGAAWRPLGRPFARQEVVSLAVSPVGARDRTFWAVTTAPEQADDDRPFLLWRSNDDGRRWQPWLERRGRTPMVVAVSPRFADDGLLFVGFGRTLLTPRPKAWDVRNGVARPLWRAVDLEGPTAISALAAFAELSGRVVLLAATDRGVYRSLDRGATFTSWSEGLGTTPTVALAPPVDDGDDRWVYAADLGGSIWRRATGLRGP